MLQNALEQELAGFKRMLPIKRLEKNSRVLELDERQSQFLFDSLQPLGQFAGRSNAQPDFIGDQLQNSEVVSEKAIKTRYMRIV